MLPSFGESTGEPIGDAVVLGAAELARLEARLICSANSDESNCG